jgi:hypothetical protein
MKVELTVATIAGVFAVISALFAYWAQVSAASSQRKVAIVQLAAQQAQGRQRPFFEAQMKFYIEATETAAQIPRATDSGARELLVRRFTRSQKIIEILSHRKT